jgi:nucleoside diphosphate kinase
MTDSPDQLAYVMINPYTIYKSRTGGVISRLFTRTALDLVAARMFAPSAEFARDYAATIMTEVDSHDRRVRELIREYILENYGPDPKTGRRRRVMMLVFRGPDAVKRVSEAVGKIVPGRGPAGETIRDTFGDYILGPDGQVRYFEPAVLAAPTTQEAEVRLKLFARYAERDGGLLEGVVHYPPNVKPEQTLVLLKPDNFRFPSGRPGSIVDMFSRTGLYIIGIKVHHMTVAQAREFYGPVREVLREKFLDLAGTRARAALEKEFGIALPVETEPTLAGMTAPLMAEAQFNNIVGFMTGQRPEAVQAGDEGSVGPEKIVALVYEGPDAVRKIRNVLGPTDPRKAPPGTIRRELGQDIMVNAAHASDSPANAKREMGIINVSENNLKPVVEEFYHCHL